MHHFPGYRPGLAVWVWGSSLEGKRALCATLPLLGDKSVANRWQCGSLIPLFPRVLQAGRQPSSLHRQRGARAESCLPEKQPFPLLEVFWGTVENSTPCHGLHAKDQSGPEKSSPVPHLPLNPYWNTGIQHRVHHSFITLRLAVFFFHWSLVSQSQNNTIWENKFSVEAASFL